MHRRKAYAGAEKLLPETGEEGQDRLIRYISGKPVLFCVIKL